MKVLGLIGENGAGKGTMVEILKEMFGIDSVASFTYSSFLTHMLEYFGLPMSRANLQALAEFLRALDPEILGKKAEIEIRKLLEQKQLFSELRFIMVDGIRKEAEIKPIKKFNGAIIYITAKPEIRYERLKRRAEKKGETHMDFEQFLKEEVARADIDIPAIGAKADFIIENNGDIEDLRKKINEFVSSL